MNIDVVFGGQKFQTQFAKGYVTSRTTVIEEGLDPLEHGTTVTFKLDDEVWADSEPLNINALRRRIKQIAYLNPGLNMYMYVDQEGGAKFEETYLYPEGLKTYIEELTTKRNKVSDIISIDRSVGEEDDPNQIDIQLAMTYTDAYNDELYTFCNNMATFENGDHLTGFTMGLNDAIKAYMAQYKINFDLKSEDVKEGLVAIVSVRVADPIFEGQAKSKLKMMSVRAAVRNTAKEIISEYLDKNPTIAKSIIAKIEQASKARLAAQRARENQRKSKSSTDGNAAGLADCAEKDPAKSEIFLVEGDSAGGSAKQGRCRHTQAILPVFGKIANVEKMRLDKVLSNAKLKEITKAIKVGFGEECDIEKLRYHKIVIMADADKFICPSI